MSDAYAIIRAARTSFRQGGGSIRSARWRFQSCLPFQHPWGNPGAAAGVEGQALVEARHSYRQAPMVMTFCTTCPRPAQPHACDRGAHERVPSPPQGMVASLTNGGQLDFQALIRFLIQRCQVCWRASTRSRPPARFVLLVLTCAWRRFAKTKLTDAEVKQCFQTYDADGGGTISRTEFVKAVTAIDRSLSVSQADALMRLADLDGDGEVRGQECSCLMCLVPAPHPAPLSRRLIIASLWHCCARPRRRPHLRS